MQHKGNQSGQRCEWFRRGDGDDDGGDHIPSGTGRSLGPSTSVPPTVLVTNMGDGSLVLESWRDGPTAYLSPADAVPLRRVLSAIFENAALTLPANQDNAR